jgi:adenine phosphoribosyltransferase
MSDIDFGDFIASYPNFPKDGVLFRDVSPLLASPVAMKNAMDVLIEALPTTVDLIAGIESRGFLFSTLLAARLNIGSLMIRKPGKLPGALVRQQYELEYGSAELAMQKSAPVSGCSVVIVDDLLATGGTLAAAKTLLLSCGANVLACAVVVELLGLGGRAKVGGEIVALKSYDV